MYSKTKDAKENETPSKADVIFFLFAPFIFLGNIIENINRKNIILFLIYIFIIIILVSLLYFGKKLSAL
jgi:RsiW-degrading membrane proteinase PrsW (M82 family)